MSAWMSVLAVQRIYFSYGTSLLARITQKKNIIQLEFRDIFWVGNECFYDFKIVQNQKISSQMTKWLIIFFLWTSLKIGVERKMCQWSYLLTKKHFLVFQNWIKECAFRLSVFRGYIQENFLSNKKCLKLCTQNTLLLCLKNKLGEKNDMCNKVSILFKFIYGLTREFANSN